MAEQAAAHRFGACQNVYLPSLFVIFTRCQSAAYICSLRGSTVALDLHGPHLAHAHAEELMVRAHERCPYSNATRGNVDVALSVEGTPVAPAPV